jgi:hypothetical protein
MNYGTDEKGYSAVQVVKPVEDHGPSQKQPPALAKKKSIDMPIEQQEQTNRQCHRGEKKEHRNSRHAAEA